jgi:predicted nucleic acid-binding protein
MTETNINSTLSQADIATILDQLRAEVRAHRVALGQIEPSPLERDLQRSLDEIELYRVVSAHWPLLGKTLPQRAVALLNKLVRRYLRWYINPIVEQQNAYNDAVARALRLLADAYIDLGEQLANTERRSGGANRAEHVSADLPHAPAIPQGESDSASQSVDILQALVSKRALAEPPASFPDLELRAAEPQLQLREQVLAHWPLTGATLPQRAVALLNKLVRRYLRWYINPIVEQQNAANAAIRAALLAIIRLDADRRAQVAALRATDKLKG